MNSFSSNLLYRGGTPFKFQNVGHVDSIYLVTHVMVVPSGCVTVVLVPVTSGLLAASIAPPTGGTTTPLPR